MTNLTKILNIRIEFIMNNINKYFDEYESELIKLKKLIDDLQNIVNKNNIILNNINNSIPDFIKRDINNEIYYKGSEIKSLKNKVEYNLSQIKKPFFLDKNYSNSKNKYIEAYNDELSCNEEVLRELDTLLQCNKSCIKCNGKGEITTYDIYYTHEYFNTVKCDDCNGTGLKSNNNIKDSNYIKKYISNRKDRLINEYKDYLNG